MEHQHTEKLVEILATKALYEGDTEAFFRNLVLQANLPQSFLMQAIGFGKGNPTYAARNLILWANNQGGNPQDPRFTVLGSLLQQLLPNLGLETASFLTALIFHYALYRDPQLLRELPVHYESLGSSARKAQQVQSIQPDFQWRGPSDQKELQALWQPRRVTTLDVAFIQRGIQQAASVCRVERPDPATGSNIAIGTGFLVKQNLLLTNYHVLAPNAEADPATYLADLVLRFGYLTSPDGKAMQGQTFKLAADPIQGFSPTDQLDYVFLEVESSILGSQEIHPVTVNVHKQPIKGMGISLLHHSEGQTMKLAIGSNGITGVYESEGLLQYCSETSGGASGSPCFNDDWQVVALHHAQKAGSFGVYCEGILLSQIYQKEAALMG